MCRELNTAKDKWWTGMFVHGGVPSRERRTIRSSRHNIFNLINLTADQLGTRKRKTDAEPFQLDEPLECSLG